MPFITSLKVSMEVGSNNRKLTHELIYCDSIYRHIIVPVDFNTNYASIPKLIPRWWIDEDDILIREPSVIHDWLYSVDCSLDLSRKEADQVLLRAMLELCIGHSWYRNNINKVKAKSAYWSVRAAGGSHWKK